MILAVIPARYASTRFPGKPLHPLAGRPMIRHVWERCQRAPGIDRVVVATDDERILEAACGFGAEAVMTRPDHPSGTDRVAEAAAAIPGASAVVNVQGDEPLIPPDLIGRLARLVAEEGADMATAAAPDDDENHATDPNVVKVVVNAAGEALYFSRSPLPWDRDAAAPALPFLRHLGIYAYRPDFLARLVAAPPAPLERTEKLEQLRALHLGGRIRVVESPEPWPGVDTPEQAAALEDGMREH